MASTADNIKTSGRQFHVTDKDTGYYLPADSEEGRRWVCQRANDLIQDRVLISDGAAVVLGSMISTIS
jgi:hypothetical protein